MNKDKEPNATQPPFDKIVSEIVKSRRPPSLAIAINNPNISDEEYKIIHKLIGTLSRNPLYTDKTPENPTPTNNEDGR